MKSSSLLRFRKLGLTLLAGAATSAGLHAQGIAEDFSSETMPASLQLFYGSLDRVSFANGQVTFSGVENSERSYLTTQFSSYYNTSFTAELSFMLPEDGFVFFGLGASNMLQPEGNSPAEEPGAWNNGTVIGARFQAPGQLGLRRNGDGDLGISTGEDEPDLTNTFARVRMVWDGQSHAAVFSVDVGNNGTFDYTSTSINGADLGFTADDMFLYFGGNNGLVVDDFTATAGGTPVPEPATYALFTGAAALGILVVRRRPKTAR
jgi:hypothetical protein